MANNDDQVAFLDYFCDAEHSFDYAVLIDAPWGSGKTYFLREYLKQKYPPSTKTPAPPPEYLWVSLFGRANASEVRDALFAEAHPMLSSKWSALGGTAVAEIIKKVSGVDVKGSRLAERFLPDIKAKLIVFDDLERSTVGPTNALGLINSFVESGAFKVIVIANQKQFAMDNDYRLQKEKVIGRTLTVMSDPDAVLSKFTESLRNQHARDAVTANRVEVLAVFRASGYYNFRSLRASLDDFDRLVEKSDSRLAAAPTALRDLLIYLVAIGMEVRADAVQGKELEEFLATAGMLAFTAQPDSKLAKARQLINKYPSVRWRNPIISPSILGRLIEGGVLPLEEVNEGLAFHPLIVGARMVPAWLTLWRFNEINATDYAASRASLLEQLGSYSVVHPGEILHLVGIFISLKNYGDNIVPDIEAYFLPYIDELLNRKILQSETAAYDDYDSDSWASYAYQNTENSSFITVRDHLKDRVNSAHKLEMVAEAAQLLERLRTPGSESDLYESDRKTRKFGRISLLQNIPVSDFADVLIQDSKYNTPLMAALNERYRFGDRGLKLTDEKPWLIALEAEVRRRIKAAPAPLELILEAQTDSRFNEIRAAMGIPCVAPTPGTP